jgi:glycosyltransferase involved in cell wall biosynthesis
MRLLAAMLNFSIKQRSDCPLRLAILASHPVQYYAPLFRTLAHQVDLTVFYAHNASHNDQAAAGFGVPFEWDVDLLSGYRHVFLTNVAHNPSPSRFTGADTPEIGQRLREGSFDALLVMGWYLKSYIQAIAAAKRAGLPVMVRGDSQLGTPRSALKTLVKAALYPLLLRQFDAALIVGMRNREYWTKYGYPAERMFVSPHCIDGNWFASRATDKARADLRGRLGIKPATKVALFAGKLVKFKRPLAVLEAAARVRKDGLAVEVVVAGSGPLESALVARAEELKLPLHLLGFCNQSQMPGAYAASDLLVLPSTGRETWGLVVNEALACGTPVLVSDTSGCAPDVVEHLGRQAVFTSGNISDLASGLKALLLAPPSANRLNGASEAFSLNAAAAGIRRAAETIAKA